MHDERLSRSGTSDYQQILVNPVALIRKHLFSKFAVVEVVHKKFEYVPVVFVNAELSEFPFQIIVPNHPDQRAMPVELVTV